MPKPRPPDEREQRGGRASRIVLRGPAGCLAGGAILLVAAGLAVLLALLGLIAFTVAAWAAAGLMAVLAIAALLRGRRARRPGPR